MNKLIVLDWDGTIIKKNILDTASSLRAETINGDKNNMESMKRYTGIFDDYPIKIELNHLLHMHYLHFININGDQVFYPDVLHYLHEWSDKGYKIVIVSNLWSKTVEQSIDILGYSKLFGSVYANSEDLIYDKKSILEQLLTELDRPFIYIGDDLEDVSACKDLGIKSAVVLWGRQWDSEVYPDYLLDDFEKVNNLLELYDEKGLI